MKYYTKDNKKHQYGDYDKLSQELLTEVDKLAQFLGQELLITSGYRAGDPNQHGKGFAVDIVPTKAIKLMDLYLAAERFSFKGIGVYPNWSLNGSVVGGLHLDKRAVDMGARWIGLNQSASNPDYIALSIDNLKKYGIV